MPKTLIKRTLLFSSSSLGDRKTLAEILRSETVGGVLMLVAAVAALVWANTANGSYESFLHLHLGPLSLEHWASDGLLTIFFFVAGLELKRELTVGSLSRPADALVPLVAAVAGMVTPAAVYLIINLAANGGRPEGWAVPMATDIAFALAILAVVGRGLPASLRAFLLTMAIVDDLGAIVVIAIAFTESVQFLWLAGAVGSVLLWWQLQRRRVDQGFVFLALGLVAWLCTWQSGLHPTVAGVALGLATRSLVRRSGGDSSPAEHWEHIWRPLSAGFAVPVFALLAAGVEISPQTLAGMLREPLVLGIVIGLVVGKAVGVFGGAYLTARLTRAELAPDLRWSEVFAVSVLGGVGFTVALLVSDLAFGFGSEAAEHGKAAVLVGSLLAAVIAAFCLVGRNAARRRREEADHADPERAEADRWVESPAPGTERASG